MTSSRTAGGLPLPDPVSLKHGERVAAHLRRCIRDAGGSVSFAEYMHEALYAPALGYYTAGAVKFGRTGDFVTAPEVSPLFGRVMGRACASVLDSTPGGSVLELGAGSGRLAADILESLAAADAVPERYLILEVSPDLRQRQASHLDAHCPALASRVEWVSALPEHFRGVIIANEVADALPVERFVKCDGRTMQCRVSLDGDSFAWRQQPAPPFLEEAVQEIEASLGRLLPDGYTSEVSAGLPQWIDAIARSVEEGFVLLVDYGLPRHEYYAPDRGSGWLRCHFRHHVHDDPLRLPGIQDLTAWVDFTAVAEAATGAGMTLAGFVTQARFLLNGGLDEEFAKLAGLTTKAQIEAARQVKILTLPEEMGENVKCMGLTRRHIATPSAFATGDRAHTL